MHIPLIAYKSASINWLFQVRSDPIRGRWRYLGRRETITPKVDGVEMPEPSGFVGPAEGMDGKSPEGEEARTTL